jgi:isopenicillin N synthase-like dioxygenase
MAAKDFPIIDVSQIDDEAQLSHLAQQIAEASASWGFLLLKNHGIPEVMIDDTFALARSFFVDLPEDEKKPFSIDADWTGYSGALSDRAKDDKATMWFSGRPGDLSSKLRDSLPPFWRPHIAEIEAFKHSCHELVIKLLTCFALAMKLPPGYFAQAHAEDGGNGTRFRMLCYPARSHAPESSGTQRMSAHSDSGSVTLLFQTCSGLEVESPTGEWVPAPHLPGHILVNLGDALAFWSGGRLKATKHRVTFTGVPHNVERLTMVCEKPCSAARRDDG